MNKEIHDRLAALSREEYENTTRERGAGAQKFYSRPGRFIIERRRISDIATGEPTEPICLRTHPMIMSFPEHTHDFIEIMYVYSGSITHKIADKTVTLSHGELLILGRGAKHSIEPSGAEDLGVNLIISPEMWEELLSEIRKTSPLDTSMLDAMLKREVGRYLIPDTSDKPEVINIMDNIIYSAFIKGAPSFVLKQSTLLLLSYLSSEGTQTPPDDEKKRRLTEYIRSSYSTATLTEAAKLLGLSPSYVSRWVVRAFGASFKELLMEERFAAASELLLATDMPIGEIFASIGYENSSYFHREFKSRYGMTPHQYRRKSFKS